MVERSSLQAANSPIHVKRRSWQLFPTISPISTNWTATIFHLKQLNTKQSAIYSDENPCPGMRQPQNCGGVNPINWTQPTPLDKLILNGTKISINNTKKLIRFPSTQKDCPVHCSNYKIRSYANLMVTWLPTIFIFNNWNTVCLTLYTKNQLTNEMQNKNAIEKSHKEVKSITLTHKYMSVHFLDLAQAFKRKWRG